MPITLKTNAIKVKNSQGTYQSVDCIKGDPGEVSDVQVNGTSVVQNGVANVPLASSSTPGVAKVLSDVGTSVNSNGFLVVACSVRHEIKSGTSGNKPIPPSHADAAAFFGLSKAAGEDLKNDTVTFGEYPEKSKSAISTMLNGSVSVSGTTPSITALPGVRYVCGEVATLSITPPVSGCIDVVFESGSTPTVLTVNGTVKWANGFDPSSLDADTTYEINILDGLGVAGAWT